MISTMTLVNLMLTITFMFMMHPLSMGFILLCQTVMISMITGTMNQNFWFSYILFLIMVGGMLILFMYMTSIASNEKFKTNMTIIVMLIPTIPLIIMTTEKSKNLIMNSETMEQTNSIEFMMTINKFMNSSMSMILLFMMIYLLLALIATVKITAFKQGSMRQMN
uniref:NADH-ubiquinone oxidoreductase chain 6 n=1 Tax=Tenebrionidae sp. 1 ACP-2013 TaxID=1434595 RepID=A0A3G3FXE7_9CUCU|nr:NADH dehydrogenase subunit 6 [Tenebrionidae sp. 1 ACP-2013]